MMRIRHWTGAVGTFVLMRLAKGIMPSLFSRIFIEIVRLCSGTVSPLQLEQSRAIVSTAIAQSLEGTLDLHSLVVGIAPLLVEEEELDEFIANLMLALEEDYVPRHFTPALDLSPHDLSIDSLTDDRNIERLQNRFGLCCDLVDKLPKCVRDELCSKLMQEENITCSISLETVFADSELANDVSVIVESLKSGLYLYFFRTSALETWFGHGGSVNPITRNGVDERSQVYRVSATESVGQS